MSHAEAAAPSTADRILDAALAVLASEGIAGVSMRAVAREAGVAVGLANYHFDNKTELICAALGAIGDKDLELVAPDPTKPAGDQLRASLDLALDPSFLSSAYLSLRLQLWSLAGVDERFAQINQTAQQRYLDGLTDLLARARPDLAAGEVRSRAADILVVQNGVWLTAVLITDESAVQRARLSCEAIAFE